MDLVSRAKNIVLQPRLEWPLIAAEPTDIRSLYVEYVLILAAIPAVMVILRAILFTAAFGRFASSVGFAIVAAIVGYVLALVMVYVVGWIADALAGSMGGERNLIQSLKLVAYSMTAGWLGAIFTIIPLLGWLISLLAGLYGIYIFYTGAGPMKKIPEAKAAGYTIVVIIAAIIAGWIAGAIVNGVTGVGMMGPGVIGRHM